MRSMKFMLEKCSYNPYISYIELMFLTDQIVKGCKTLCVNFIGLEYQTNCVKNHYYETVRKREQSHSN